MKEHRCRWDTTIVHYPSENYRCEQIKTINMATYLCAMWLSLCGLTILIHTLYILLAPTYFLDLSCGFFQSLFKGLSFYVLLMLLALGIIYFLVDLFCRCCQDRNQIYQATNQMKRINFGVLYLLLGIFCTWALLPSKTWQNGSSDFCLEIIRLGNDSQIFDQNTSAYYSSPLDDQIYSTIYNKLTSEQNQSVLFLGISQIGKTVSLQRTLHNISNFGLPSANLTRNQILLYYYKLDQPMINEHTNQYYKEIGYKFQKIQQDHERLERLMKSLSEKKKIIFVVDGIQNIEAGSNFEKILIILNTIDKNYEQFHLFLISNAEKRGSSFYTISQYFQYEPNNFIKIHLQSTPLQLIEKYFQDKGAYYKSFSPQFKGRVEQIESQYSNLAKWCNNYQQANFLFDKILTNYKVPIEEVLQNVKNLAYISHINVINNNMNFLCQIYFDENDQPITKNSLPQLNQIMFDSAEMRSKILQTAFIQKSQQNKACTKNSTSKKDASTKKKKKHKRNRKQYFHVSTKKCKSITDNQQKEQQEIINFN